MEEKIKVEITLKIKINLTNIIEMIHIFVI